MSDNNAQALPDSGFMDELRASLLCDPKFQDAVLFAVQAAQKRAQETAEADASTVHIEPMGGVN